MTKETSPWADRPTEQLDPFATRRLDSIHPCLPSLAKPLLVVLDSPKKSQIGEVLELPAGSAILGRAPQCDLVFEDTTVSRRHVKIVAEGEQHRITHQGGVNGTLLNGQRIESTILKDGDRITFGKCCVLKYLVPDGVEEKYFRRKQQLNAEVQDLIQTANALRQAKNDAERANQARDDFLANMSHELRTPLTAIKGFSELLMEQHFGELNPQQMEYVNDIHDCGVHLLSLINDILDLAKIESGKENLNLSQFDLGVVLTDSLRLFSERTQRNGLATRLQISKDVGLLLGDKRKVKQVLFNLLSNATKFTPAGGEICLTAEVQADEYRVTVADTGRGIPSDRTERIFEKFEQLDNQDGTHPGTGLGLTLAREYVELHCGRIWVENEPSGSRFVFTLPRDLSRRALGALLDEIGNLKVPRVITFVLVKIDDFERLADALGEDNIHRLIADTERLLRDLIHGHQDKVFSFLEGTWVIAVDAPATGGKAVMARVGDNLPRSYGTTGVTVDYGLATLPYDSSARSQDDIIAEMRAFGIVFETKKTAEG